MSDNDLDIDIQEDKKETSVEARDPDRSLYSEQPAFNMSDSYLDRQRVVFPYRRGAVAVGPDGIVYTIRNSLAPLGSTMWRKGPVETFDFGVATLMPGCYVILGSSGSGKTPFLASLAESGFRHHFIKHGEPFPGYTAGDGPLFSQLGSALLRQEPQLILVDSLKDLLSMEGAAMRGGISRTALLALSTISIAAADMGHCVIAIVNPSSADASVMSEFTEAVTSSVTGVFAKSAQGWTVTYRPGEGQQRRTGLFSRPNTPVRAVSQGPAFFGVEGVSSGSSVYDTIDLNRASRN